MKYKFLTLIISISTAFGADVVIDQKNKKFYDASGKEITTINAKVGDKLIFKNSESSVTHNVYSLSPGNSFELKTQKPGEKSPVPLSAGKHKKGAMDVECAIHPGMKLKVNIQ
jgi:plastocyanin